MTSALVEASPSISNDSFTLGRGASFGPLPALITPGNETDLSFAST